jgi:hypothetical protein
LQRTGNRVIVATVSIVEKTGGRLLLRVAGSKTRLLLGKNSMVQQHSRRAGCRHSTLGDGEKS